MDLKPCPFCGARAYAEPCEEEGGWKVWCDGNLNDTLPGGGGYCGAQVWDETRELAMAAWNRRHESTKGVDMVNNRELLKNELAELQKKYFDEYVTLADKYREASR